MRGPKPQYPIDLTAKEAEQLCQVTRATRTPQGEALRAHVLLVAYDHPDWSNQQIALGAGVSDRMVRKWRKRWHETQSIKDLPRPGAPRRFPLRCERRPRRWRVGCPESRECPCPAGVGRRLRGS